MYMEKEFLESLPSPQTRKGYKNGLKRFKEFYGKSLTEFLKEKDTGKVIEKFYAYLKQKYSQNSCRGLVNSIIQYAKYNGIIPQYRKSLGMYHTTLTTRDHKLQVSEAREMWKVSGLEDKVLIKTWLLGLRIGDCSRLEWKTFNIKGEPPVEILLNTRKEGITAHVFLDEEYLGLLDKYILMLDQKNKYLFQSERNVHLTEKQLLRRLQSLQRKAGIKLNGQVFGWHIARKLFMRTSAELGITSWNAMMMVGKSVDKSISTYINGVQLREDAMKVLSVLRMEIPKNNGNGKAKQEDVELIAKVVARVIRELRGDTYKGPGTTVGFLVEEEPMDILRKYLES